MKKLTYAEQDWTPDDGYAEFMKKEDEKREEIFIKLGKIASMRKKAVGEIIKDEKE